MKYLLFAIMMTGISLCAMGQSTSDEPKGEVTGYKYTEEEEDDCTYEVSHHGNEYLLYICDKKEKADGYCMIDSTIVAQIRSLIGQTTLATVKENYRNKEASKKAKAWRLRVTTTWGPGEDEKSSVYHYGYLNPEDANDPVAIQKTMEVIQAINQQLLSTLREQQKTYGYQRIVCMSHKVSGYMYVCRDENGEMVFPSDEFWYFNYGNRCVAESRVVREKVTEKRWEYGQDKSEEIGKIVQLVKYKKPEQEYRILDAPSSRYTFYFFDGLSVSFDDTYTKGNKGKWSIPNAYIVERLLEKE